MSKVISSMSMIIVGVAAQGGGYTPLAPNNGNLCKVDSDGKMPRDNWAGFSCGSNQGGRKPNDSNGLVCIDPDTNKNFKQDQDRNPPATRDGYCGYNNQPYLGAPCRGGDRGNCGDDRYNLTCVNKNGRPASGSQNGFCQKNAGTPVVPDPKYPSLGQSCDPGTTIGQCANGGVEGGSAYQCISQAPRGSFCTLPCNQTVNPCKTAGMYCGNKWSKKPVTGGQQGLCYKGSPPGGLFVSGDGSSEDPL